MLEARDVTFAYPGHEPVLSQVNFQVDVGERVCLLAKSGVGKSTLGRLLAGYLQPQSGGIYLDDAPLPTQGFCPVQLIHQHPEQSVNPRWKLEKSLHEAGPVSLEMQQRLHVDPALLQRYPHQVSGGELQRISIARSLQPQTKFLIADEITTMLDPVTQANIWHSLLDCTGHMGLVIITHNSHLAQRLATRIVELERLL